LLADLLLRALALGTLLLVLGASSTWFDDFATGELVFFFRPRAFDDFFAATSSLVLLDSECAE